MEVIINEGVTVSEDSTTTDNEGVCKESDKDVTGNKDASEDEEAAGNAPVSMDELTVVMLVEGFSKVKESKEESCIIEGVSVKDKGVTEVV